MLSIFKKIVTVSLLSLVLLTGCKDKEINREIATKPLPVFKPIDEQVPKADNLLLIVVDTLRADRVGSYGYDRPTTPFIDSLAKEGILFEKAYVNSPWTAPSFGSLLTGVTPPVHRTGMWLRKKRDDSVTVGSVELFPLNKNLKTMAQFLGDKHVATFASNPFLDPALGFAKGVDYFDQTFEHRRGSVVTKNAIEWLDSIKDNKEKNGFFVMLHYMDVHTPYDPPPFYKKMFVKEPVGRIRAPFGPKVEKIKKLNPTPAEKEYIKGLYDGEVRYVDSQIEKLITQMEKNGQLENTWVVITSDHGEEHFEHGGFNHGYQYEDEVTRVPLIIRAPGGRWGAKRRVPYTVSLMDVFPTILDWFKIETPQYVEAKSLMAILKGKEKEHRNCFMEFQLYDKRQHAFFDGRYKIIKSRLGDEGYMYDLQEDPFEQKKIDDKSSVYKKILSKMKKYDKSRLVTIKYIKKNSRKKSPATTNKSLSPDAVKALKSLGYIE